MYTVSGGAGRYYSNIEFTKLGIHPPEISCETSEMVFTQIIF
jgi:hypothetical protein